MVLGSHLTIGQTLACFRCVPSAAWLYEEPGRSKVPVHVKAKFILNDALTLHANWTTINLPITFM